MNAVFAAALELQSFWIDVEGIVLQRGDRLDWKTIEVELAALCEVKESFDALQRLSLMREQNREEKS